MWPENLKMHLRTTFEKNLLHTLDPPLKDLIASCPLNKDKSQKQTATSDVEPPQRDNAVHNDAPGNNDPQDIMPAPPPPVAQPHPPTIVDTTPILDTTTPVSQWKAFAALHTAQSAAGYTEISSLGHSIQSRRSGSGKT